MARIFVLMSGKGGVGKSTLSSSLAVHYARKGLKTTLLDGDIGLRCADLMLGLQDRVVFDLGDLLENHCAPEKALVSPAALPRLSLLAAPQLLRPSDIKEKDFLRVVKRLSDRQDILLIDAPAGIGRGLKNLLGTAGKSILVATPDDVSVRDAERLAALLAERGEMHPGIIFNRVNRRLIRRGEMTPPAALAAALDLPLMGVLPESPEIYRALLSHKTALDCGDKQVAQAVENIAARLLGADVPLPNDAPRAFLRFFRKGGDPV